ncbi:MAG: cupin domain-containing protein [Chloroflexi bacterium]|nr:cupin domain-containing protein [Chloroflexota bacterium]
MVERVIERGKEPEPTELIYEQTYRWMSERRLQKEKGVVVVRGKDLQWEQNRQGLLKYYLYPGIWKKMGVPDWYLFQMNIKRHTGKHTHQGGLGIFVLEGKGYTVVNGVRYDWEKDDLILLPVMPGGCEHQHFNAEEGKPCFWMAFIFGPAFEAVGTDIQQNTQSPDWKGPAQTPHVS